MVDRVRTAGAPPHGARACVAPPDAGFLASAVVVESSVFPQANGSARVSIGRGETVVVAATKVRVLGARAHAAVRHRMHAGRARGPKRRAPEFRAHRCVGKVELAIFAL